MMQEPRYVTAFHEAGHVTAYEVFGLRWIQAKLDPDGPDVGPHGTVFTAGPSEHAKQRFLSDQLFRKTHLEQRALMLISGYVAEWLLETGGQVEPHNDGKPFLPFMHAKRGTPDWEYCVQIHGQGFDDVFHDDFMPWIVSLCHRSLLLLRENWGLVRVLAHELYERGELSPARASELKVANKRELDEPSELGSRE
jgi:hypothetical protein